MVVIVVPTNFLQTKIGIIGGGQLGQMMILEAKKMGFYVIVLDPTPDCPAHSICDEHIIADFNDKNAFALLAEKADVITYEFEHINADALLELENKGYKIYPTAKSLKIIQDKFTQKTLMAENGAQTLWLLNPLKIWKRLAKNMAILICSRLVLVDMTVKVML